MTRAGARPQGSIHLKEPPMIRQTSSAPRSRAPATCRRGESGLLILQKEPGPEKIQEENISPRFTGSRSKYGQKPVLPMTNRAFSRGGWLTVCIPLHTRLAILQDRC